MATKPPTSYMILPIPDIPWLKQHHPRVASTCSRAPGLQVAMFKATELLWQHEGFLGNLTLTWLKSGTSPWGPEFFRPNSDIINQQFMVDITIFFLLGGWATPLKNMNSSIGMMTFPIYGKIKNCIQTIIIFFSLLFRFLLPNIPVSGGLTSWIPRPRLVNTGCVSKTFFFFSDWATSDLLIF